MEPGVHTASRKAGQRLIKGKLGTGERLAVELLGCCVGEQDHAMPVSFAMIDRDDLMQILAFGDSSRWRSESEPSRNSLTAVNQRCQL